MNPQEEPLFEKEYTLAWLRLGFSITAILLIHLNPQWTELFPNISYFSVYAFSLYSLLVLYLISRGQISNFRQTGFVIACLDLFWISLIVLFTGGIPSSSFAFFLFPVITSGFLYGIKGSLSVALIASTIYAYIAFTPFWARPLRPEAFTTFVISLLIISYIFGSLFDLEMKRIQKLMSLSGSAARLAIQGERRRIAHELHDRVLQVMGSLIYKLEACRKYLVHSPKELEAELALSEATTQSSMREIRSVLSGKVTDQFTPGTLLERLREEIKSLHDSLGLSVAFEATPEHLELAQEVEREIFYAAREGLSNIAHHSQASEASLSLKQTNGELRVCLEDNGLGFEPTSKEDDSGYGLQSMRERISNLGGDFSIKSAPGMGTRIFFTVPLFPTTARPALNERRSDQLEETRNEGSWGWSYLAYGSGIALFFLLILAIPYFFYWQDKMQPELFADSIARYHKLTEGIEETSRAASSVATPARLLDLRPLGYTILSWGTGRFAGHEGRVFVYRGSGKEYLLAEEFDGTDFSPPPGGKVIRTAGRDFVCYKSKGVNLVTWKQNSLLSILVSTIPKEKIVELAQQLPMGS